MRTLLHSHTRTCYGAAFCTAMPSSTISKSTTGTAGSSSRGKESNTNIDSDADHEDSKTAHKRNLDFSDDKDDKQYESKIEPSSGQCLTWSSDCSIRYGLHILKTLLPYLHCCAQSYCILTPPSTIRINIFHLYRSWDISVDGLCTDPVDTVVIPDFPMFCCALKNNGKDREFVCGGGNGDPSFVGTPIYLFSEPKVK